MMISNGAMPPTSLSLGTLINRNRRTRPSSVHCKRQAFLYLPKVSTGFTEPCAFSAGSHLRGSSIEPPVDETKRCSLYAQAKRQTHVVCASKSDNSPDKRHKHPRRQAGRSSAEEENNYGDHKLQHLYFDEVTITVSGGQGGDGEAWLASKPKTVRNFKYKWGRNTKKFIELPAAEPADGGRGGNVYIRVDRSCESLLHIHQRKLWRAKKGYHGSSAPHATPGRGRRRIALTQEDLYINVPAGTVVRRKRSGELLGDMTSHGMAILVAEGGAGGLAACSSQQIRSHRHKGLNEVEVSDFGFEEAPRTTTRGETGEEVTLELLMRVVADIGIVGLPNAGKSSILKAITRATPEVASYPFTTLMPNIGVIKSVRVGSDEIDGSDLPTIGLPVLADLPGLIKGAHKGRGLGRAFLRHLRRTRAMMIVVDVSGQNPTSDYLTIREELRLYNPDYILRPHILVLNKIDVEWAAIQVQEITTEFQSLCESVDGPAPIAVLPVSAVTGSGLDILISELVEALRLCDENHANARASAPKDTTP